MKPWALLGGVVLAWWYYAAPIQITKKIRSAAEEPHESGPASLISSRVDFARVNALLDGDLRRAAHGQLDGESFSRLLLRGRLPQQSRRSGDDRRTRLHVVRYKDLNRFMAVFWDEAQTHQIVLTLQREGPFHRWRVTQVAQFNMCAYDFDCGTVTVADLPVRSRDAHPAE